MHKIWSRAEKFRSCKESHEIFPAESPAPRRLQFYTSYESEKPAMGLLLGWEYGRLWLKEHKEFVKKELTNAKPIFIDPDFSWWVTKRTVVMDRRQYYLKKKQNPHMKNCNLSAFAIPKSQRLRKAEAGSNSQSQKQDGTSPVSDANRMSKAKKCNCKDCKTRCCGGVEIKSGTYGPDNRKLIYVTRKVDSMPWY